MSDLPAALERLWLRLRMMVCPARMTTGDDTGAAQMWQISLGGGELRDNTPRVGEYGLTSNPPPGSEAVVIFMGGDRSQGVIIATGSQTYRLRSLKPGEVALYDNAGQSVLLGAAGIVVTSPKDVTVRAGETLRIEAADVQIHASRSYRFDVAGHGEVWHPTSVDGWTMGETPGTPHPISPPEIG